MFVKKEINLTTDAGDTLTVVVDQEEGFNIKIGKANIELLVDEVNELADTLVEAVDYYNGIKDDPESNEDDDDLPEIEDEELLFEPNKELALKATKTLDSVFKEAGIKVNKVTIDWSEEDAPTNPGE